MALTADDHIFLKEFFHQIHDEPLSPQDPRYVPLYMDPALAPGDPVELMARAIEWTAGESVQLLSGFRGTGKSTELRRLEARLNEAGYLTVLSDADHYVNMSTPVDISDFLIAVAGALSEGLVANQLLADAPGLNYWDRLADFVTRVRLDLSELSAGLDVGLFKVGAKGSLKEDPTFRKRLQDRMAGHLGALVSDVRAFIEECVKKLKDGHGQDKEVVFLFDSIEHIRGTSINAAAVHASVETLFASHADKLRLPYLHAIYTVPPYLKVRYANLGALYSPGGVHMISALKLRGEDGHEPQGGLDAIEQVTRARGDWQRLLGHREVLDRIALCSGGHLRDFLRLLAEVLRRADRLPVEESTVEAAINQIKSEFLPIADADAAWLARIAETHQASLPEAERLPDLARFLDTHLVLSYGNGPEWYDAHPLVVEQARAQARQLDRSEAIFPEMGEGLSKK